MPLLVHAVARPLAVHGEAVELAGKAGGEIGDIDHLLHFALAFGQDFAHLERNQRAEILLVLAQFQTDLADDFAPPGSRHHAPIEEGLGRARYNALVIGRPGQTDFSEGFAGRRISDSISPPEGSGIQSP